MLAIVIAILAFLNNELWFGIGGDIDAEPVPIAKEKWRKHK